MKFQRNNLNLKTNKKSNENFFPRESRRSMRRKSIHHSRFSSGYVCLIERKSKCWTSQSICKTCRNMFGVVIVFWRKQKIRLTLGRSNVNALLWIRLLHRWYTKRYQQWHARGYDHKCSSSFSPEQWSHRSECYIIVSVGYTIQCSTYFDVR